MSKQLAQAVKAELLKAQEQGLREGFHAGVIHERKTRAEKKLLARVKNYLTTMFEKGGVR